MAFFLCVCDANAGITAGNMAVICLLTATPHNGTMTETSCLELSVSLLYTVYVGDEILCSRELKGIWESLLNKHH